VAASDHVDDKVTKVWRYMSFSRFVWLLQKKQLWLSRADLLGDPWEISLAGDQLAHVISCHPAPTFPLPEVEPETAMQRSERIIKMWRQHTFINCWSASAHESHALWRIYCPTSEGVAIQTTLAKLQASVGGLLVYRVTYAIPGSRKQTPTRIDLMTKKRPMFAYEQEVRIIRLIDEEHQMPETVGCGVAWDFDNCVESIRVHPEADPSFMDTVIATVECYSPTLKDRVAWSAMNARPPF
jgi:hypothetical protein